jgi:hypothetical protein
MALPLLAVLWRLPLMGSAPVLRLSQGKALLLTSQVSELLQSEGGA